MKTSTFLYLLISGFLVTPTNSISQDRFTPADIFELEFASDPQISPDGGDVVYVRNAMDILTDRPRSSLWMIKTSGSQHKPLTPRGNNVSLPRWSRDGKKIIYTASPANDPTGPNQIFLRWIDTGETTALTHIPKAPESLAWSPDGKWIAFTMLVSNNPPPFVTAPAKPKGATWAEAPKVIDKMIYRADGKGFLEDGFTQLFVLPADGGTPRQLTSGPFHVEGVPCWMPDGKSLLITSNRRHGWETQPRNTEIFRVTVADGAIQPLTNRNGPDEEPIISPDGKLIAYTGYDDKLQGIRTREIYIMNADGTNHRALSDSSGPSATKPFWAPDGNEIYFQHDIKGETMISKITLDGYITRVQEGVGGTFLHLPYPSGTFSISDNHTIAYTKVRTDRPSDVAVGNSTVTDLNGDLLSHKRLGSVEERWVKSTCDDKRIQYWIVKPPGMIPGKKYPMILEIHGGPFSNYGPRFSAEFQLYAAADYVVIYANPRGSTSYGEEFATAIHHNFPGDDFDDLMSVVDEAIAEGFIDERNLFITGGSAGGILTSWIVGKTDRFNAAVAVSPVINWTSFVLTTDRYNYFYKYWFPGPPWEHPEIYWKTSPLSLVGKVKTPTMILTGEDDFRTPMSESEQYFQALKINQVDTMLVRFPGASHSIARRPSSLISKNAHILKWFERYVIQKDTAL